MDPVDGFPRGSGSGGDLSLEPNILARTHDGRKITFNRLRDIPLMTSQQREGIFAVRVFVPTQSTECVKGNQKRDQVDEITLG
jgi:hypothetical protein